MKLSRLEVIAMTHRFYKNMEDSMTALHFFLSTQNISER